MSRRPGCLSLGVAFFASTWRLSKMRLLVREALVGVRLRLERDETEASGTLGYVVAEHECVGHFAKAGEVVLERLVGRVEAKTADEQFAGRIGHLARY